MYLTQLTLPRVLDWFSKYSVLNLEKLPIDLPLLNLFSTISLGKKRSLVKCDTILNGVVLHLKDVELSHKDISLLSRSEKRITYNHFSHFCRTDRAAGRKLFAATCEAANLDPMTCNYESIENRMSTSLQVFNTEGFLIYNSPLLQPRNCILCLTDIGCYLVRAGKEPAFGKVFHGKRCD